MTTKKVRPHVEGTRLEALTALRDRLAEQIDETASARDLASLASRLTEVLEQIDTLKKDEEEKPDDLANLVPAD